MAAKEYKTIVKSPIYAGMPLNGHGSNRMRLIGHNHVAIIFDSKEKDCVIGERRIKQVLFKHI